MSFIITVYSIIIISITVYLLLKRLSIFKNVYRFFNQINRNYISFYKRQKKFFKGLLVIFMAFYLVISISTFVSSSKISNVFDGIISLILSLAIFYIIFGIPFLIIGKVKDSIPNGDTNKILWVFLIDFSYIYLFTIYSLLMPDIKGPAIILLVTLLISYFINMSLLIIFIKQIKQNRKPQGKRLLENNTQIYAGALFLILAIVFNMYLNVYVVHSQWAHAYQNVHSAALSAFDLLYYTIITFATVGYGDIVPIFFLSKLFAIQISLTSVVCLVVFVNSLMNIE